MARSNWKGVISFGLVTVPVILYPSKNKQADISFHQIDKRNNARIQYQRINSVTGKKVAWEEIIRGYEFDKETMIPVPDAVLKSVAGEKSRSIDIETFVNKKEINFLTLENVYYLVPDKNGDKGYVILREALQETNKVGIAKVIISTKEYLAAIVPHHDALLLCLLKYDDEMKKASEFDLPNKSLSAYKVTPKEVEIAKKLINSLSTKWRPEKYKDQYQQAIHRWVDETVKKLPHKVQGKPSQKSPLTVNFVDLLRKSLAQSGKSSGKKTKKAIPIKAHKLKAKSTHRKTMH